MAGLNGEGTVLSGWPIIADNYFTSPPSLIDIDGDGVDEIFVGEEDFELHGYRADGTALSGWPVLRREGGQGDYTPAAADLDNDGYPEIVSATSYSTGGVYIYAFHRGGAVVAGYPFKIERGYSVTYVSIGDVDGDGSLELVAVGREKVYPYDPILYIISATAELKRQIKLTSTISYGVAPTLADLDGDRVPEILVQTDIAVYALKGDGTPYPGWPVVTGGIPSNSAPVVGDVDGDGQPDVVVIRQGSPIGIEDRVYVFDRNGISHPRFPKALPIGAGSVPAISDIDGDGRNEIIVAGRQWTGFSGYYDSLWVYDLGGPAHGPVQWGQFAAGPKHHSQYVSPATEAVPSADIRIQTAATPDPVIMGDIVTIAATVTNVSQVTAQGIVVTHVLPPTGVVFVSADAGCALNNGIVRCRIGELAPGASTSVNVLLSPTEARTLQLRSLLAATTSDPNVSDNDIVTAFTPIPPTANLSVSLNDTPDPAKTGLPLNYDHTVVNNGPQKAFNVVLTYQLPGTVSIASIPAGCTADVNVVTCEIGEILPGSEVTGRVVVVPMVSKTTLTATATITGSFNDPSPGNNTAVATTTVRGR